MHISSGFEYVERDDTKGYRIRCIYLQHDITDLNES